MRSSSQSTARSLVLNLRSAKQLKVIYGLKYQIFWNNMEQVDTTDRYRGLKVESGVKLCRLTSLGFPEVIYPHEIVATILIFLKLLIRQGILLLTKDHFR